MIIRRLATLAAAIAIGLLALGSTSASASTSLRGDPGGGLLAGSTTFTNTSSGPAVVTTGVGAINCANTSFVANPSLNSSATTIGGLLLSLTFTTCTDTIPLVTITTCHLHTASGFPTISLNGSNATVTLTDTRVRCGAAGAATGCYYTAASASGTANNAASTLTYTNVNLNAITSPTTDAIPAGACGTNGVFSVQLRHMVQQGTNRTVTLQP